MANRGKLVVLDLDNDTVFFYGPIDEWIAENREADPVLARKVNRLKVGDTLRDGGGAQPLYLIARLA